MKYRIRFVIGKVVVLVLAFSTPDPAASQVFVQNYDGLRSRTGSGENQAIVRNTSDSRFDGDFAWRPSDPYGNGDDSTLVIADRTGYWVREFEHTEGDPIQLGWYEGYTHNKLMDSFIEKMASGIGQASGGALYLKATTITGVDTIKIDYTNFRSDGPYPIKTFYFMEDIDSLWIHHTGTTDIATAWEFHNYDYVVLGGQNLYLFFVGNRPGLGTGTARGSGLVDASQGESYAGGYLFSWSANARNTEGSALNHWGTQCSGPQCGPAQTDSMYIKGEFWNTGNRINGAVHTVYFDNPIVMDPFLVNQGWDGTIASNSPVGTKKAGCYNPNNRMARQSGGCGAIYVTKVVGSCTGRYGSAGGFSPFSVYQVGYGPDEPFVVYEQDRGVSGPTELTGYPSDVMVKNVSDWTNKVDQNPQNQYSRFFKYVELPQTTTATATGFISSSLSGCSHSNNYPTSRAGYWRSEASDSRTNAKTGYLDITFEIAGGGVMGATRNGVDLAAGAPSIQASGTSMSYCTPGPACDRVHHTTLRAGSGTTVAYPVFMMDSDSLLSVDGTGKWERVEINLLTFTPPDPDVPATDGAGTDYCRDNVIKDTWITEKLQIKHPDCDGTVIENLTVASTIDFTVAASFACGVQGIIEATDDADSDGTFDLSDATDRATLGASGGGDHYLICGTQGSSQATHDQNQTLTEGWNTVSLFVDPSDRTVESVTQSLGSKLLIVKDGLGNIYYPQLNIDSIGDWALTRGYQINVSSASDLAIRGMMIDANTLTVPVNHGWNLVPFLRSNSLPVDDAMVSIEDNLVMVKDNDGSIYYPQMGINTLSQLRPGQGYFVYVEGSGSLRYPGASGKR